MAARKPSLFSTTDCLHVQRHKSALLWRQRFRARAGKCARAQAVATGKAVATWAISCLRWCCDFSTHHCKQKNGRVAAASLLVCLQMLTLLLLSFSGMRIHKQSENRQQMFLNLPRSWLVCAAVTRPRPPWMLWISPLMSIKLETIRVLDMTQKTACSSWTV